MKKIFLVLLYLFFLNSCASQKISEIQEKTSKLVLNAMLFEQQCKQINKAQQDDCTIM